MKLLLCPQHGIDLHIELPQQKKKKEGWHIDHKQYTNLHFNIYFFN